MQSSRHCVQRAWTRPSSREQGVLLGQRPQRALVGALGRERIVVGVRAQIDQREIQPVLRAMRRRTHAQQPARRAFREAAGHAGQLTVRRFMDSV